VVEWEYLTCKELANLLQLNQQTVRNWLNAGELEYVQRGRTKYIPRHAAVALAGGTGLEMPDLLTVTQVAALLRLNPQTIRNWIDAGTFPARHIGRRVRIKRTDLDAFIDSHSSASADQFWGDTNGEHS
jgi:excisionase family DNA binding protein